MKITDVKTWVVGNPPPGIGGRYFIFVRLTTDGGVVGYGEAYNATFGPHVTARMIEDMAERYLLGRDPHDIETFFRRAYSSGFTQRPDVSAMGCFSALEIACWDIIGKEAGQAGLQAARRPGARDAALLHLSLPAQRQRLYRRGPPTATSTTIPISPPNAPAATSSRVSTPSSSIRPGPTPPSTATSRG